MRVRAVSGFLLVAMMPQLAGCTVWRVQQVAPSQALLQAVAYPVPRARVRLRADNSAWVIQHAQVVGDSIVGILRPEVSTERARRVAFALGDVRNVAVSQYSGGRTALALGGVAVIALVIGGLVAMNNSHMGFGGGW
jgi:hypothetical protein